MLIQILAPENAADQRTAVNLNYYLLIRFFGPDWLTRMKDFSCSSQSAKIAVAVCPFPGS